MSFKLTTTRGKWAFVGEVPMELARKAWPDKYAAVQAAEKAGYICMANGECRPDNEQCSDPDAEVNLSSGDDYA